MSVAGSAIAEPTSNTVNPSATSITFNTSTTPGSTTTGIGADATGGLIGNAPTGQNALQLDVNGLAVTVLNSAGRPSTWKGAVTQGVGLPIILASYTNTAQAGALTNVVNFTPSASIARFRLSWTIDTTTATTDSFKVVITYKNATGTARTLNSGGFDPNGTALAAGAITNVIGAGNYYGSVMFDIDNSATAITLSTAGTFTTVTYNISAILEQLA